MKKVAIYGQYLQDHSLKAVEQLIKAFHSQDCEVHIEQDYAALLEDLAIAAQQTKFQQLDASYELLISIGGDGTILRAVTFVGALNIPILGVNTGRLGFLATVPQNEINEAISQVVEGNYHLSKRTLLTASSEHDENHKPPYHFALNEVTVSRMNTTSMIQIETHLNGELLTSYWADGLIVSTPTGSTGYSLSCGGPVISPETNAFVITPIAPHNLNGRPLVIPDHTVITVRVIGREEEFLASLDNRIASYPDGTVITLKKADFTIDLIELHSQSFIETLRHKLLWGEDKRN